MINLIKSLVIQIISSIKIGIVEELSTMLLTFDSKNRRNRAFHIKRITKVWGVKD